jgi:hypothetical protein
MPVVALCGVALLASAQLAGSPPAAVVAKVVLAGCALVIGTALVRVAALRPRQDDARHQPHVVGHQ